jgi:hypothetical protein
MKHLKLFENFLKENNQEKIDNILDKISSSGMDSLTPNELELLNKFGNGEDFKANSYNEDEDEDDMNGVVLSDRFLDDIITTCNLPLLRDYEIETISNNFEYAVDEEMTSLIYCELKLKPKDSEYEIFFTGIIEMDENLNYKGYSFTYNEDVEEDDEGDSDYFDSLVETDSVLSNNIELFLQEVCQDVKNFLLTNDLED